MRRVSDVVCYVGKRPMCLSGCAKETSCVHVLVPHAHLGVSYSFTQSCFHTKVKFHKDVRDCSTRQSSQLHITQKVTLLSFMG